MHQLNLRVKLYEPATPAGRSETGQLTRPRYRKHQAHARITSAVSGLSEAISLITAADVRLYLIRWREDIDSRWFLEDAEGNWFRIEGLSPTLGGRRRGFLTINCRAITDPDLQLEE